MPILAALTGNRELVELLLPETVLARAKQRAQKARDETDLAIGLNALDYAVLGGHAEVEALLEELSNAKVQAALDELRSALEELAQR